MIFDYPENDLKNDNRYDKELSGLRTYSARGFPRMLREANDRQGV